MRVMWINIWYTFCTFSVILCCIMALPLKLVIHQISPLTSLYCRGYWSNDLSFMICRPLKILMWKLTLCPFQGHDVIKREKMIPPLSRFIKFVPLTLSSGQLFPWCNSAYIFGTDLPLIMSRRYVKGMNWASVSSEEWEVLPLINFTEVQLRVH